MVCVADPIVYVAPLPTETTLPAAEAFIVYVLVDRVPLSIDSAPLALLFAPSVTVVPLPTPEYRPCAKFFTCAAVSATL